MISLPASHMHLRLTTVTLSLNNRLRQKSIVLYTMSYQELLTVGENRKTI